jgi:polar amino acid transport system substrate-binding protein
MKETKKIFEPNKVIHLSKYIFILFGVLLVATIGFFIKNESEKPIQVAGIEFVPNFFIKENKIVGIDADIASVAFQNAGVNFEMSIANSWDEAYNKLINGSNSALLTTGYSLERKDLFKWAGPTSKGMYGIFTKGKGSSNEYPLAIEDSKNIGSIAVVKNWLETITLENLGFTDLVYFNTYDEALAAFMNNEVRFIASDFFHLTRSLPDGYYMEEVHVVTRYHTVFYYIAFSKDVSDTVVRKIQNEIDNMVKNQTTASIVQRYFQTKLPTELIPGIIQLFAESAPPYSFYIDKGENQRMVGCSVEIVNEIQKRNGYIDKTNISTWEDAYQPPKYLPNSAVYTIARTPERENMFQWVGPISRNKTFFYTLTSSGINKIENLEQAMELKSIATPKEWYTHDFLRNNHFNNIVADAITSKEAFDQLINGEVEVLFLTDTDVKWLAKDSGIDEDRIIEHMEVIDPNGYIAFSLDTPTKIVEQWQANLDAMKADGIFDIIWEKWMKDEPKP